MDGNSNDIESQIDSFLEHFKRSAARAMEDRSNDGWLSNENLVHSIIKRSRSGMSSSDDGTLHSAADSKPILLKLTFVNQNGVDILTGGNWTLRTHLAIIDLLFGLGKMEFTDTEKETSEILRSLLSVSRVQNQQVTDVNYWQQNNCMFPAQEQIVWQIDSSNDVNKRQVTGDNRNIIHHIPVTYLTTDNRNISFTTAKTIEKPVTYVLSHNVISEAPKNNENEKIILNEPQKIVFIQEIDSKVGESSNAVYNEVDYSGNGEPQVIIKCKSDYQIVDIENDNNNEIIEPEVKDEKEAKRKLENEKKVKVKKKKIEEEDRPKTVAKKKIDKKNMNKKRKINSKLKNKLKKGGKPIIKKPKKTEASDGEEKKEDGATFKGNHNELTKLEDNAEQVAERFRIGCECSEWNCFDGLNPEKVFKHRLNIADLTKAEHDMYLMGVIMASMQNPDETCRHKERVRIRSSYAYQGKKVCLTAFLYLEHVTLYQMKRLRKHLKYHGVSPRIHGNHGRKPANTLSLDIYQHATNFVQNYIEKHSVKSVPNFTTFSSNKIGNTFISGTNLNLHDASKPGGKKPKKIKIANKMTSYHLSPECTKKTVHDEYKLYCEGLKPDQKVMQYSTFTSFLKKQFPNVKFHKIEKKSEEKSEGKPTAMQSADDENGKQKKKQPKKIMELFDNKNQGTKNVQTPQVYSKTVQISPPPLIVAQKQPATQTFFNNKNQMMKTSQIVLNGPHLQFCTTGASQLQSQNQVLVGNQIISAHCVSQAPTYTQHVYTMHNINDN